MDSCSKCLPVTIEVPVDAHKTSQDWPPYTERERALRDLEERLTTDPDAPDLQLERAGLLAAVGRTMEARNAYLALPARDPSHRLALNHLGTLLYGTAYVRKGPRTEEAWEVMFAEPIAERMNEAYEIRQWIHRSVSVIDYTFTSPMPARPAGEHSHPNVLQPVLLHRAA